MAPNPKLNPTLAPGNSNYAHRGIQLVVVWRGLLRRSRARPPRRASVRVRVRVRVTVRVRARVR